MDFSKVRRKDANSPPTSHDSKPKQHPLLDHQSKSLSPNKPTQTSVAAGPTLQKPVVSGAGGFNDDANRSHDAAAAKATDIAKATDKTNSD